MAKRKLREERARLLERLDDLDEELEKLKKIEVYLTKRLWEETHKKDEGKDNDAELVAAKLELLEKRLERAENSYNKGVAALETLAKVGGSSTEKWSVAGGLALTAGLGGAGLYLAHRDDVTGRLVNKGAKSFFDGALSRLLRRN